MRFKDYLMIVAAVIVCALLLKEFVVDAVVIPSQSMESTLLPGDYVIVDKLICGGSPSIPGVAASVVHLPGLRRIQPGDVIVFRLPADAERRNFSHEPLFVKRCVGVGGDQIRLKGGILYKNGMELMKVRPQSDHQFLFRLHGPLVIPRRGDRLVLSRSTVGLWIDLIRQEGHTVDTSAEEIRIDGKPASSYTFSENYLFVLGDNRDRSYDSGSWGLLPEKNVIGAAEMVYWSRDIGGKASHLLDYFRDIRWNRIGTFVQ